MKVEEVCSEVLEVLLICPSFTRSFTREEEEEEEEGEEGGRGVRSVSVLEVET